MASLFNMPYDDPRRYDDRKMSSIKCDGDTVLKTDCPTGFAPLSAERLYQNPGWRQSVEDGCPHWLDDYTGSKYPCFRVDRTSFPSNPVDCCMGIDSTGTGGRGCAQEYFAMGHTNLCSKAWVDFCSQGDNMITHSGQDPNPPSTRCGLSFSSHFPDRYNEEMVKQCRGDNLESKTCTRWCAQNEPACSAALYAHCKDKDPSDPTTEEVCGCHYSEEVYARFYNDMLRKYQIGNDDDGLSLVSTVRTCFFPPCQRSAINDLKAGEYQCPSTRLSTCFNEATIGVGGSLTGNVTVNQSCENSVQQRVDCSEPGSEHICEGDQTCSPHGAGCVLRSCVTNSECNGNNQLDRYRCAENNVCRLRSCTDNPAVCGEDTTCLDGECVPACESNLDCTSRNCSPDGACQSADLVIGCNVDGECPENHTCNLGLCEPVSCDVDPTVCNEVSEKCYRGDCLNVCSQDSHCAAFPGTSCVGFDPVSGSQGVCRQKPPADSSAISMDAVVAIAAALVAALAGLYVYLQVQKKTRKAKIRATEPKART